MREPMPAFGFPIGPWVRWFAWYPVWTNDYGNVWLRYVWRRQIQKHDYLVGGGDLWFQHSVTKKGGGDA